VPFDGKIGESAESKNRFSPLRWRTAGAVEFLFFDQPGQLTPQKQSTGSLAQVVAREREIGFNRFASLGG
jgi:hypothetical protein